MSERASASLPSSCSGDMYWYVPSRAPASVSGFSCVGSAETERSFPSPTPPRFARPKSISFDPDFVSKARYGLGFTFEALAHVGVVGQVFGQHLDGDRAIEAVVPSPVDLTHAPGPQEAEDFVGTQPGSRSEAHREARSSKRFSEYRAKA